MPRKIKRLALVALCAVACGGPLGPEPMQWRLAAPFPADYLDFDLSLQTTGPRGVYFTANSPNYQTPGKLIVFDGNYFKVDYDAPNEFERLSGVGFYGDDGWLIGRQADAETGPWEAFLIRYEKGVWGEKRQFFSNVTNLTSITSIGPNGFYCLARVAESDNEYIAKYENGSLAIFNVLGSKSCVVYARDARMVLGHDWGKEGPQVIASADGGASWSTDKVIVPVGYEIESVRDFTAGPDALYLTLYLKAEEERWYAIIKRTGAPGEGVYKCSYLGYKGPGRGHIEECAFRNAEDGVATGEGGALYHDAAGWKVELCGPTDDYKELTPDPRGGFWAIFDEKLYWHP